MTSRDKNPFTANYNGEPIKPGETMVPFPCGEYDEEACVNKECIKTVFQGGKGFKVIYKAVPDEWTKTAKSALNLVQNEALGHYDVPNSISRDSVSDGYGLELGTASSAEAEMLRQDALNETMAIFVDLVKALIEKNPKLGYAVMLVCSDVKGTAFYSRMCLTRDPANRIRQQAKSVLKVGLASFDVESITHYRSKNDDVYRREALKLLNTFVAKYR